jgi:hypothetical protein
MTTLSTTAHAIQHTTGVIFGSMGYMTDSERKLRHNVLLYIKKRLS